MSDLLSSVFNVLFQERLVDDFNRFLLIEQHPDFLLIVHIVRMVISMHIDNKTAQIVVQFLIGPILHHFDYIESTQNWIREVDIVHEVDGLVVLSLERVSCSNYTTSGT